MAVAVAGLAAHSALLGARGLGRPGRRRATTTGPLVALDQRPLVAMVERDQPLMESPGTAVLVVLAAGLALQGLPVRTVTPWVILVRTTTRTTTGLQVQPVVQPAPPLPAIRS